MFVKNRTLSFFLLIIIWFQSGCVTARLSPKKVSTRDINFERSFLSSANLIIVDEQFPIFSSEVRPIDFYQIGKMPLDEQNTKIEVRLQKCKIEKGFWENPYTLLTILGVTIGNIYECKTSIQVSDLNEKTTRSYDFISREYGYTGLGAFLWGPFMVGEIDGEKRARVRSALYLYFEKEGIIPKSVSNDN